MTDRGHRLCTCLKSWFLWRTVILTIVICSRGRDFGVQIAENRWLISQFFWEARLEFNLNKSCQSTSDNSGNQTPSRTALPFSLGVGKSLKISKGKWGKADSEIPFFCHLLSKKIRSFGSSEASRLTPGFIAVSSSRPRKQKAGSVVPPSLLS